MNIKTIGSLCSGIEAASVAWAPLNWEFQWFSEIADFPSEVLKYHYPNVKNIGDMSLISQLIKNNAIESPDLICGGTPCQAFSVAGWKKGLEDDRGNLTLEFVNIIDANDLKRKENNKDSTIVFWENVEGVLTDKTNAFGSLVSSLAGFSETIELRKWPSAGILKGPTRNLAWRVLDAKYFGLAQQRKRLYLLAGGKDFFPENILFETSKNKDLFNKHSLGGDLQFVKNQVKFEVFRSYSDCLYAAYGTKWNGNAAAYNGSLFVSQDERVRRLSPLECERLMGFPDNYTDIPKARKTNRYQALGNSWAVPVVSWIGKRLFEQNDSSIGKLLKNNYSSIESFKHTFKEGIYYGFSKDFLKVSSSTYLNTSSSPNVPITSSMFDVVSSDAPKDIYISPTGCYGIIRRKNERKMNMNSRLEEKLLKISSELSPEEIEKRSRVQKRGKFSEQIEANKKIGVKSDTQLEIQLTLF